MRTTVWVIWACMLGAGLAAFAGVNVIDNPIWFILIDGSLILASWYAFNLIWPANSKDTTA